MSTEVAQRTPLQEVVATIRGEAFKQEIGLALPGNVTPERFVRVTVTAINQTPELITADRASLFASIVKCAQDGLLPDGRQAALVIFKVKGEQKVSYLPMVGGLRYIAANHGVSLEAHVVYKGDEFDWELGFEPSVTHAPPPLDVDRGDPIGAYAVGTDASGRKYLEVMSKQEIEAVRKVSKTAMSEYGPWVNWWGEMARKTVARRLFKQLPFADLSEKEERIIRQADADVALPSAPTMTVDEANVAAPLTNLRAPTDDGGPDDEVVDDGVYE